MAKHDKRPEIVSRPQTIASASTSSNVVQSSLHRNLLTSTVAVTRVYVGYRRFSTDEQDAETSLRRQTTVITRYARGLGVPVARFFTDEAQSAAFMSNRADLQSLLAACDAREVTDVIIEDYDRLCREAFDAADLCRCFERAGVRLHCASEEIVYTKELQIQQGLRAERDRKRRATLLAAGIDMLVEAGGVPGGAQYGYDKTDVPGFPVVNEVEAAVILRIFTLAANGMSFGKIRRLLVHEGHLDPSGRLNWPVSTLYKLATRVLYTGWVVYRRFHSHRTSDGSRSKRVHQPAEAVQKKYNDRYRIVSDELFDSVQVAIASRRLGDRHEHLRPSKPSPLAEVTCDCPGAGGVTFGRRQERTCVTYRCRRGDDCLHPTKSVQGLHLETAVVGAIVEAIEEVADPEAFKLEVAGRLAVRHAEVSARREEIQAKMRDLETILDRLLERELQGDWGTERTKPVRIKHQTELNQLRTTMTSLASSDLVDLSIVDLSALRDTLDAVMKSLPMKATTEAELAIVAAIRRIVPKVVVRRWGLPFGEAYVDMELHLSSAMAPALPHTSSHARKVSVRLPQITFGRKGVEAVVAEHTASQGHYALTDDQWTLVSERLDMATAGARDPVDARTVADAVVFKMRTGVPMSQPPAFFGNPTHVFNAMQRFVYHGGIEILVDVLGAEDPSWTEGLDLVSFSRIPRSSSKRAIAIASLDVARSAIVPLTDAQWALTKPAIHPTVEVPVGSKERRIDARDLMDSVIYCLRTACPWPRMPSFHKTSKEMRDGVARLRYSRSWEAILDVWSRHCPELLEGLPIEKMFKNGPKQYSRPRRRKLGKRERVTKGASSAGREATLFGFDAVGIDREERDAC